MAKTKQTRRMMAMALAAAVTMSSVPVVAFADEVEGGESTGTVTVTVTATPTTTTTETKTDISTNDTSDDGNTTTSYEGHKTETSVTEGTTEGADGTPVTTPTTDTKIDTSFDNTLADGELSKSQTTDETTTTVEKTEDGTVETVVNEKTENSVSVDAEGNVIETTNESGSETVTTTTDATEEDLEGVELPEVTVDFSAENDTNSNDDKITVEVTEKVQVSEAQKSDILENGVDIGDKTVIEEIERIVKAELSATTTTDNSSATIKPIIAPEDYDGKNYNSEGTSTKYTEAGTNHIYRDYDGLIQGILPDYGTVPNNQPEEPGYDFQKTNGAGDVTDAAIPVVAEIVYKKDANENLIIGEDGKPEIDWEATTLLATSNKGLETGMTNQVSQIVVQKPKENGEGFDYFYTYCVDRGTPTAKNHWYKVADIEDADYFSDEAAEKIRTIAENGYWGTEEGTGSLASIKDLMKNTYGAEDTVTVTDKDGTEHTYKVVDLIEGLKEHEAMACTQAAIWSYSNGCSDTLNGQDGVGIIGVQSAIKYLNSKGTSELMDYNRDYDLDSDARLMALYECLMGLEPQEKEIDLEDETKFNTITDIDLVIGDKAESYIVNDVNVNDDGNDDNDAFETSVQFTVAIIPSDDDYVTVAVLDAAGNMMKDADGNTILKRLVGADSTVDDPNAIKADSTGAYTLDSLVFQENTDVNFSLKLEGLQSLGDKGVYIFQAYGADGETDRHASQTLVGLGERVQDVDITQSMTLKFDVDDNKKVTATSTWSKSGRKVTPPTEDPGDNPPGGDNPPSGGGDNPGGGDPTVDIDDPDVPLSDIPDEDVPLADIGEEDVPLVAGAEDVEEPMVLGAEEEAPLIAATGDSNHMAAGFGGMFAALAGMFMLRRKKEQ